MPAPVRCSLGAGHDAPSGRLECRRKPRGGARADGEIRVAEGLVLERRERDALLPRPDERQAVREPGGDLAHSREAGGNGALARIGDSNATGAADRGDSAAYSRTRKRGIVMAQSRAPGLDLPPDAKIDLRVSRGRPPRKR